jgi:hypothetical protein
VQQPCHQRHPRRSAHQEQPGELVALQPGVTDHPGRLEDAATQQRYGQPLQLFPGQVYGLVDARHRHRRGRRTGQHLLGTAHVVPELPAVAPLHGVLRVDELLPGLRRRTTEQAPEVLDQDGVQIQPTQLGDPAGAQHAEPRPAGGVEPDVTDHGDVERPAAEVEDGQRRADRHRAPQHVGEVPGRRHRLGQQ